MKESAGVAGPDHSQVGHLHEQLGPEMRYFAFAVVDVMFKSQQELLLAAFDPLRATQARAI